jgi:hypothetical protein
VLDTKADGIYTDVGKDRLGDFDAAEAPSEPQTNAEGGAAADRWTFEGTAEPAGCGQAINQAAPLHMRAPRPRVDGESAGLGQRRQRDANDLDSDQAEASTQP